MKSRVLLLALPVFLALTACVETTQPLCNAGNRTDPANFARDYQVAFLFDPTQALSQTKTTITRHGVGEYTVTSGKTAPAAISVCKIQNWTIVESATAYSTFQQYILGKDITTGLTNLNLMIFDSAALTQANVPFKIVERDSSKSSLLENLAVSSPSSNQKTKVMVIDNSSASANAIVQSTGKPEGIGLTIY